jgi:hypothetical protein
MTTDPTPLLYQPYLEALTAFASEGARRDDLLAAKAEYIQHTGELFEDDTFFELRMASFLDHYLFDRVSPLTGKTPAEEYLELKRAEGAPDAGLYEAFTQTLHGLFEVRKLGKGYIRLRELYSGKDYDVTERRQTAGLDKGDVIEARLIPFDGALVFSQAFTFHPKEAVKSILAEVKRRKKKEPERPPLELTWECAKRAVKAERYRQIPVERIYDFTVPPKI